MLHLKPTRWYSEIQRWNKCQKIFVNSHFLRIYERVYFYLQPYLKGKLYESNSRALEVTKKKFPSTLKTVETTNLCELYLNMTQRDKIVLIRKNPISNITCKCVSLIYQKLDEKKNIISWFRPVSRPVLSGTFCGIFEWGHFHSLVIEDSCLLWDVTQHRIPFHQLSFKGLFSRLWQNLHFFTRSTFSGLENITNRVSISDSVTSNGRNHELWIIKDLKGSCRNPVEI
jgi:hypothetical protein